MSKVDVATKRASVRDAESWSIPVPAGVSVGQFAGFDDDGRFSVLLAESDDPVTAVSTIGLTNEDVGVHVAMAFENGGRGRIIIIGRLS